MEVFREDFVLGHPRVLMHYWTLNDKMHKQQECGPMPNVMATLPNIGGALCSMLQSLADVHY